MNAPLRIAVIYNIPSKRAQKRRFIATDTDTQTSAEDIWQALIDKGATVALYPIGEDTLNEITRIGADCIFNVLEWDSLDLELSLQALTLLKKSGIAFTGSDEQTVRLTGNKHVMKTALQKHHLPTAPWQVFETGTEPITTTFRYPVLIKPCLEHCSIGLDAGALAADAAALRSVIQKKLKEFAQPVIAEEFIAGKEYQITVYEKDSNIVVLPPAEIVFYSNDPNEFLTFESRWDEQHADYQRSGVRLASVTPAMLVRMTEIAQKTFSALGFSDYSRLDVRVRGNDLFILEANSNPGLGDEEDYGMTVSYKAVGMTFADFIWAIVQSALRRFNASI